MFGLIKNENLPSAENKWIYETEEYFKIKFPQKYVEILREYNGATIIEKNLNLSNKDLIIRIGSFLSLLREKKNEFEEGWTDIGMITSQIFDFLTENPDNLGLEIIPIIFASGDCYICLDYRESKVDPKVCYLDTYQSEEWKPYTIEIADNFDELLKLLNIQLPN